MMNKAVRLLDASGMPLTSGYSGAGDGFGGQLRNWSPPPRSADAALLPGLARGNARADDLVRNHGVAQGGVQLHVDNIVGHLFRLSAKPRWQRLGISEDDARSIARDIELLWTELVEDPSGLWLDAERKRTFTMFVREAVATHVTRGEVMASAEWIEDRPPDALRTGIKTVNTHRVSNPNGQQDTADIRGGIRCDRYGAARSYFVRNTESTGLFGSGFGDTWIEVPRETSWGRQQFLHVFEPTEDGQTRGANRFLAILEQCHMLGKLQNTKLQNAIVNAMYAATIETELGGDLALEIIGAEGGMEKLASYMGLLANMNEGMDVRLNGVRIPHLVPGEKLNLLTPSNADNGFAELEASFLRYMASGLGLSVEQLARDYSKTNYSSARASLMETWRYFMGRRKVIAARYASMIYALVLEELFDRRLIAPPRGARGFYEAKAAWCNAEWIGTGRIAIDGLKEVKEAVLRIESGLSTYEKELAVMGEDYQEVFAQQVREIQERSEKGLPPPSWMRTQALAPDEEQAETA
ncbi:MAG TPA: phage portal protein [Hyphomicrobiales bacterium]|nr:phage portal protein [Hyphomicrobiales bacterium]